VTTHLEVNAGDMTSTKELNMMLVLVNGIVVDARVLARVPVKHKLTIVQSSHSLLSTKYAEVALLQLSNHPHQRTRTSVSCQ